jgi:hypothetical protein
MDLLKRRKFDASSSLFVFDSRIPLADLVPIEHWADVIAASPRPSHF